MTDERACEVCNGFGGHGKDSYDRWISVECEACEGEGVIYGNSETDDGRSRRDARDDLLQPCA